MNREITLLPPAPPASAEEQTALFELQQRKAKAYSASTLVPKDYQGNPANVIIAMNIAGRLDADDLMVMQNLHIIHGKPGWSGQFLIACLNQCGKFGTIRYIETFDEKGQMIACQATAKDKQSGEVAKGPEVTWEMATKEGWTKKSGSKWMTMRDVMFRYRAAAFFVRTICPEIALGLPLADENRDVMEQSPKVSNDAMEAMREALAADPGETEAEADQPIGAVPEWDERMKACTTTAEVLEVLTAVDDSEVLHQDAKDALADWGRELLLHFKESNV